VAADKTRDKEIKSMTSPISTDDMTHAPAIRAARKIPPAWPLDATVAVNPFLGRSGEGFGTATDELERLTGTRMLPSRDWFRSRLDAGEIANHHLEAAAAALGVKLDLAELHAALEADISPREALPTIADLATQSTGTDWKALAGERIGHWAAGFFDTGQALWTRPANLVAWKDWRDFARNDLTTEIHGLTGFASEADAAPANSAEFIALALQDLAIPASTQDSYLQALLLDLGGWAQMARQRLWIAEKAGGTDQTITDLLAIRLFWDWHLARQFEHQLEQPGLAIAHAWAGSGSEDRDRLADQVWQTAAEYAAQEALNAAFQADHGPTGPARPDLQAVFCIDVRSEVFRRALESTDGSVETIGFAGFFGITTAHHSGGSDVVENRMPVLVDAGFQSVEGDQDDTEHAKKDLADRYRARARRAWGRFKLAAVSSFAFVESAGLTYLAKLGKDALIRVSGKSRPRPRPCLSPMPALETRIQTAETVLRAMSLTDNFARLVLLVGHGADVVNNPAASALQCGACGGHSGAVNARLLAGILNDPSVRDGLAARGLPVPDDTIFVAALHDTVSDTVTLFHDDHPSPDHTEDLARTRARLASAGKACRAERVERLPGASRHGQLSRRGRDWAQTRPEWGLAGCRAFIAAPRHRTVGAGLSGQAFLHSYDWRADEEFSILELILTAPVVVASWINLQYYGSAVAPDVFGSGNKLLHNVTGGIGVVEGNGSALRAGLPWQSVHDGERLVHDPLRLSVCIEAPIEAINGVLAKHGSVRELFDNHWLHLLAQDETGCLAWRYTGDLTWAAIDPGASASQRAA
jgi:uncharacterized protein